MNSKLLKLNEPYKVIYAGGKVGRHIATLFTWEEDEDGSAEILESHEYPIIDQGEEFPAGTLVTTEIEDCRVICGYNPKNGITGTNLYWLAGIIEYDFQQLEPSGAEYILKRLELLDCQIKLPEEEVKDEDGKPELDENGKKVMTTKWDYTASLWVSLKKGRFEGERELLLRIDGHSRRDIQRPELSAVRLQPLPARRHRQHPFLHERRLSGRRVQPPEQEAGHRDRLQGYMVIK